MMKLMNKSNTLATVVLGTLMMTACDGQEVKKAVQLKSMEVIGNLAQRNMGDDVAGGFHNIPIEVRELAPNVFQATGIANTHLITTSGGDVLFDSGISIQAAKQLKLLAEKRTGDLEYIVLSHSHADHISGAKFYLEEATEVVTHREFPEEQRYLTELEVYLWNRNRTLFPWMPEEPATNEMLRYGGLEPDILVTEDDYAFELGDTRFEVLSTPGAEGADNISLWLPDQKILFSGDFFGPLFPQFPNVFTMRGEKIRKPIEYIASLNKLIALEPEMIVPSHHDPITGKENLRNALVNMRDAVQHVHDEVVAGMNAGKTVYELMREVQLPEHIQLTQEHGKVSWAVKSIWEYYATWFHFDSTTELYPVPARDVYSELGALAGPGKLVTAAQVHLDRGEPVKALHLLEVALAADETNQSALKLRLATLEIMLAEAVDVGNNYEKDYLRYRVRVTQDALGITQG
jgi:alkyl sulfatase BDS1-like metallo-beta-lactamase superfamily hydrolase